MAETSVERPGDVVEILTAALQLARVPALRLWLLDAVSGDLVLAAMAAHPFATPPDDVPNRIKRGHGLIARVLEFEALDSSPALDQDGATPGAERLAVFGSETRLVLPVRRVDRIVGALVVHSRDRQHFSPEERTVLSAAASAAALSAESAGS